MIAFLDAIVAAVIALEVFTVAAVVGLGIATVCCCIKYR